MPTIKEVVADILDEAICLTGRDDAIDLIEMLDKRGYVIVPKATVEEPDRPSSYLSRGFRKCPDFGNSQYYNGKACRVFHAKDGWGTATGEIWKDIDLGLAEVVEVTFDSGEHWGAFVKELWFDHGR